MEEKNQPRSLEDMARDPGFLGEVRQQIALIYHLMRDPEVPIYLKFIPVLALLYFISPIDLIPGAAAPVLGGLDDLTALLVAAKVFIDLSPPHLVARYSAGEMRPAGMSDKECQAWEDAIIIDAEHERVKRPDQE